MHVNVNAIQQPVASVEFPNHSQLPEWMSDDQERLLYCFKDLLWFYEHCIDSEVVEFIYFRGGSSNLEETGSFDDSGQFQAAAIAQRMATSLDLMQDSASDVSMDISERFV